jgi:acylphosphatase
MARISIKVLVIGRVQGVSFRAIMREKAIHFHVDGWVRNRNDGSVEAVLQGEEAAVRRLIEWARSGPPRAKVSSLTERRLGSHQLHAEFRILD